MHQSRGSYPHPNLEYDTQTNLGHYAPQFDGQQNLGQYEVQGMGQFGPPGPQMPQQPGQRGFLMGPFFRNQRKIRKCGH